MAEVKNIFDVAGRAMSAQLVRLNTIASNLANANNVAGSAEEAYKPIRPIFETKFSDRIKENGIATVDAVSIEALDRDAEKIHMPDHPKADKDGYTPADDAYSVGNVNLALYIRSKQDRK